MRRGVGSDLEVIIIVSRPEEPFIRVYTERELAKLKDTNFIKRLLKKKLSGLIEALKRKNSQRG